MAENTQAQQLKTLNIDRLVISEYKKHFKITDFMSRLHVRRAYAEKYLSPEALKYGTLSRGWYVYPWGKESVVVFYELPVFWNMEFPLILRLLVKYASDYMKEKDLNDTNYFTRYQNNYSKQVENLIALAKKKN